MSASNDRKPRPNWQFVTSRAFAVVVATSVGTTGMIACEGGSSRDRWVVTENTTVEIDWDAINEAYRNAEGPEDFEKRVNEIYTGEEIVSISVRDNDERSQVVTGFFDKNADGKVDEGEKIFTIQRDLVDGDKAQYGIQGHGAYGYYRSPMWDIASGMMMGAMLSNMFMPGYRPTAYTTSPASRGALASQRNNYRAANPSKFQKPSGSGRTYNKSGGNFGGSRSGGGGRVGGGRFGRRQSARRVVELA